VEKEHPVKLRTSLLMIVFTCIWGSVVFAQSPQRFTTGELLQTITFDADSDWELYQDESSGIFAGVDDGEYRMTIGIAGFTYGIGSATYENLLIEVDGRLVTDNTLGQYGTACRLDADDSSGYLFLVDGSNYFAIIRSDAGDPQRLRFGRLPDLDNSVTVRLRAVCVDNYLALYINDRLVAEAFDDTYTEGYTALIVSAPPALEDDLEAAFDNLMLYEAAPASDIDAPLTTLTPLSVTLGDVLLTEPFDSPDVWENFSQASIDMRVEEGGYRATSEESTYAWAQNTLIVSDVVIDVTTRELEDSTNDEYGVVCRADEANQGLGYYFMISSDGSYQIAISDRDAIRSLSGGTIEGVINRGDTPNRLRIVCVGNVLALYVNDQLLAVATDDTYSSGVTGFVVQAEEDEVDVIFDDLTITEAALTP
jgi:hypothetical protein